LHANNAFSETIQLSKDLNKIIVTATDRSGATSVGEYYINRVPYDGEKLWMTLPTFGVAEDDEFDVTLNSYVRSFCRHAFVNARFSEMYAFDSGGTEVYARLYRILQ